MSRILGIDYGDVRTGIAITDDLCIISQGLETFRNDGSDKKLLKRIEELLNIYDIDTIVLGNPINADGTEGIRSQKTKEFMHKLKSRFNKIKVEMIDERYTTIEAYETMRDLNIKNNRKKELVDTIAAANILESYMKSIGK